MSSTDRAIGGDFRVVVGEPHPAWIELYHNGKKVLRLRHDEISDLLYALRKAAWIAKQKLGARADEVEPVL